MSIKSDAAGLIGNWSFVQSRPDFASSMLRIASFVTGLRRFPSTVAINKRIDQRKRWNIFFLFLPTGELTSAHRYTLQRLREAKGALGVICASPGPAQVPKELSHICDAVYWKALEGYDFSAYSFALNEVAKYSSGADVFLMNDSVFGPFGEIESVINGFSWQLSGFTGHCALENHIQSYAFFIKEVTPNLCSKFSAVLLRRLSLNRFSDVVRLQETRFARVASEQISVGALWFQSQFARRDPMLYDPFFLISQGVPFLKKSLYRGKFGSLHSEASIAGTLEAFGHPI